MRVLTVRQPWAWAIIHGGKDVENRARSLGPYRGLVAIHAAKGWATSTVAFLRLLGLEPPASPTSAVIGVVDLIDVHDYLDCLDYRGPHCSPWAMPDHHHLELANPRPLAHPIPAKGRLGLWRPDAELEAAIREQIGGA